MLAANHRRRLRITAIVFGLLLAVAIVWVAIHSLLTRSGPVKKHTVHQIAILKPPPPPPPPPKQEKPPEVKKEEVKIKEPERPPEQEQQAEQPPPGQNLGVDADGSAGGDAFGLISNKSGRDLITLGEGGSGERSRYAGYTNRLQRLLQDELARNANLRKGEYRATVRIWLTPDGGIRRVELAQSTGNTATDELLRAALTQMSAPGERPPDNMPQPVRLRITSRIAG